MYFTITIAGSDSISGAGVQEDLKTCTMLGTYCFTVITSVTAQNTFEVISIHDIPENVVRDQIDAIMKDVPVKYGKTGMLSNREIINAVVDKIQQYDLRMVVDPVMVAKSGARLLRDDAIEALKGRLLPSSFIITPNIDEAEVILGRRIMNVQEMEDAAFDIHKMGAHAVIVKGGHMEGNTVTDVFYDGNEILKLTYPRIKTKNTHGSGCTFSSAIASYLSRGYDERKSFILARKFLQKAMENNIEMGHGHGPLNPMYRLGFKN